MSSSLLVHAIETLAGGALVLDAALRVTAVTPAAERLLGARVPAGAHAVKLLCSGGASRPLAEALAIGRPVTGSVPPLRPTASDLVVVRARPLPSSGRPIGWLLLLSEGGARPDDEPWCFHGMWTRDVTMKRLFHIAEKVASSDASVLIQGEMGTGKASLAAAIHALSARREGPFRTVSCVVGTSVSGAPLCPGTVPFASDVPLAAHVHEAAGGTLFLDDVEALPLESQGWLLRAIESGLVAPPAGGPALPADVRVIAATRVSLAAEVEADRFRADLMHCLRTVSLCLPPLRARRGDVELLAEKLVADLDGRGGRRIERIAPGALARLAQHAFPGNVRELRAAIESAFATGEGPVLAITELPAEIADPAGLGEALVLPAPAHDRGAPPSGETDEASRVRRAIDRAGGNRSRAAALLGMSRSTLWRRMKTLGLHAQDGAGKGAGPRKDAQ